MREIVRSAINDNVQFVAIDWNNDNLMQQELMIFENAHFADALTFNETIEQLYKKWLVGEPVDFTNKHRLIKWNVAQQLTPDFLIQTEKNEYLAKKAQRIIQNQFSAKQYIEFENAIQQLQTEIAQNLNLENAQNIFNKTKALDESIKLAVAATKHITLEQKWVENGITNDAYLALKPKLNELYDSVKAIKSNSHHDNYNLAAPKVEAAYAQSKVDENFSETRKHLIAIQKEVIATDLERWQKNELLDRIKAAFDHVNARQDEWRAKEDLKRDQHAATLQAQFDSTIPKALEMSFGEGFAQLKELQDVFQKASLHKEQREIYYARLDEAFKTLKQKADVESEANITTAKKIVEVALLSANNTELFKEARSILTNAQNELKEIRLSRQHKDELFAQLRTAFEELNTKQDAFFNDRKKENRSKLEDVLQNFKRIVERKKEGMQRLYQAQENATGRLSMFKMSKKTSEELTAQFDEKAKGLADKIADAEKDLAQLEKKVEKIQKELDKLNGEKGE
jgi:exonuclease VII small subunit